MTAIGESSIRRRARRAILAGLTSALVAGACAGAAAAETFHVGGDLSPSGVDGREPEVAVNDSGDQAFAWRLDGCCWEVQARLRTGGVLGPPRTLSAAGDVSTYPGVAILANGDALVVWNRYDYGYGHRVEAQTLSTANVLGPLHTLSDIGGTVDPQVAVDASGNAVIAWRRWNGEYHAIEARTLSAAGALGAEVLQISEGDDDAGGPQVAFDANGVAVLGWTSSSDGGVARAQTRTLSPAGTLGDVVDLSTGPNDASSLRLAVEPDGDAVYAWQQLGSAGYTRIKLRTRSAAGDVGAAVETISGAGVDAEEPQLGADADGDAVVAWLRDDGAGEVQVKARTRTAAGVLGGILTLSKTGRPASHARLAVSANGTAVVTWSRSDGANEQVKTRKLYPSGVLGPVGTLSDPGLDADEPAVAIDDHGSAVHAWRRIEPGFKKIQFDAACCGTVTPSDEVVDPPR